LAGPEDGLSSTRRAELPMMGLLPHRSCRDPAGGSPAKKIHPDGSPCRVGPDGSNRPARPFISNSKPISLAPSWPHRGSDKIVQTKRRSLMVRAGDR
jgi:hypothetical protein